MKKGYSLIELLIASTIFAAVLLSALTSLSSVTKFSVLNEEDRKVSVAGFEMTQTVARIARYATAAKDGNGDFICQGQTDPKSLAAREGIIEISSTGGANSSSGVYINVKVSSNPDIYRIHHFLIRGNAVDYYSFSENVFEATTLNGARADCGFTTPVGSNTYSFDPYTKVLWDATAANRPFKVSKFSATLAGSEAGNLTLDPAAIDETAPVILQIKIKVGQFSGTNILRQKTYQTSISPRFYNQSQSL